MRFHVYQDKSGAWRWRMVARNGETVADGGQSYTRQRDALRAVKRIMAARWELTADDEEV